MAFPEDLPIDALGWEGISIGKANAMLQLGGGVDGLGVVAPSQESSPAAMGGEFGGRHRPPGRLVETDCELLEGDTDLAPLWQLAEAMQAIESPLDERPLYWRGLLWGEDLWCVFARPVRCDWLTDEEAVEDLIPGFELGWRASDPTAYSGEQTVAGLVETGVPVSSSTFEAPNVGGFRRWARRAWEFRFTAHGATTNPRIHVAHADGTWERWQFTLSMTGGQVLKVINGMPLLNDVPVPGRLQVRTNTGGPGRARRPLRLLASDGDDGNNVVTMSVATGAFSGFCKVRSTR